MKIIHITDSHLYEHAPKKHGADAQRNWRRTVDELEKIQPDLVVFGGDIGTASSHAEFFEALSRYNLKVVLGNHDKASDVARHFPEPLKLDKLYYAFRELGHTFVVLDSSSGSVSAEQLAFLKDQAKSADKILLFIHHPVLPVDSPVDLKYPLANREEISRILLDAGKPTAIFCGHNHCSDETQLQKITQYLTPAVSYQILKHHRKIVGDVSFFGYRMIHLSPEGFLTNEVRLNP